MAAYETLRQSAQEALAEQESMDVSALAMIMKLRMAACGQSKADYFVDMASEIVAAGNRAYRIGQTKDVTVYHLISAHTIEEKILRLHKVKRNLADSLLEGTHMASALTLADLRALAESALA